MRSERGFTFIELVISVSIFAVITGLMFANLGAGNRSEELRRSADLVASRLREAQTRSLTGYGGPTIAGYGIQGTAGGTLIYSYSDDATGGTLNEYDGGEESVASGFLENVTLVNTIDIAFIKPGGDLYDSGTLTTGYVTTTLTHTLTGLTIDITVNGTSGQVSVSDPY